MEAKKEERFSNSWQGSLHPGERGDCGKSRQVQVIGRHQEENTAPGKRIKNLQKYPH